jgi:pterin-4a-carbinolamine dehydratase
MAPPRHPRPRLEKIRLTLTTHSEGGLTDNDRAMAETIDGLG